MSRRRRPILACVCAALLLVTLVFCGRSYLVTDAGPWAAPNLPAVGLGDAGWVFVSERGWIEWREYTNWDRKYYPMCSLPWLVVALPFAVGFWWCWFGDAYRAGFPVAARDALDR